jgi:hypothetical protein
MPFAQLNGFVVVALLRPLSNNRMQPSAPMAVRSPRLMRCHSQPQCFAVRSPIARDAR